MPQFECPHCSNTYNSRRKREEHIQKEHDGATPTETTGTNWFGQKKLAAIVFGTLMIGLPLGGAVFYSTLSPDQPADTGTANSNGEYLYNPPVGNGYVPREGSIPATTLLDRQLPKDQQVLTLIQGGPQQTRGGLKPAALLQYSCTDCPEVRQGLEQIAQSFNGEGSWVYVAPYTDMDATIALTSFRSAASTYSTVEQSQIEQQICNRLGNLPLKCLEDEFGSNQS